MKGDDKFISIRFKRNGKVRRDKRGKLQHHVEAGNAEFISNAEYRHAKGRKLTPAQERDLVKKKNTN